MPTQTHPITLAVQPSTDHSRVAARAGDVSSEYGGLPKSRARARGLREAVLTIPNKIAYIRPSLPALIRTRCCGRGRKRRCAGSFLDDERLLFRIPKRTSGQGFAIAMRLDLGLDLADYTEEMTITIDCLRCANISRRPPQPHSCTPTFVCTGSCRTFFCMKGLHDPVAGAVGMREGTAARRGGAAGAAEPAVRARAPPLNARMK